MTEIEALESVFAAEMNGDPLWEKSIPAKLRRKLIGAGDIEAVQHTFPAGRFKVTSPCVALTHKGRIRYCEWASQQPGAEP